MFGYKSLYTKTFFTDLKVASCRVLFWFYVETPVKSHLPPGETCLGSSKQSCLNPEYALTSYLINTGWEDQH